MYFPALDNLIRHLSSLPGIGRRSAMRIAFYLLQSDKEISEQISHAIKKLRDEIRFCDICGGLSETDICTICDDTSRDDSIICVVEEPNDIYAIENTGDFKGKYHVLNGALSPLDGIGVEDIRIKELLDRVKEIHPKEIFIATNPTLEGDATARYIADQFEGKDIRVTRISHGIPTGSSIEYADSTALSRSIRGRQDIPH